MEDLTPDKLVAIYLKIRAAIQAKEEEVKELKDQIEQVGNKLLEFCNAENVEGLKTTAGTVSRKVTSRYWTSDWESMYKFIKDNDAMFLLEQRIHNGNMKDFLAEHPEQLPMGLQADRKYVVSVRKPTAK
jgi:hypothetical protein